MNAYEELLKVMRSEGNRDNTCPIQIGVMNSATSCSAGNLELTGSDLMIAEHLLTGYHKAVDNDTPSKQNATTFCSPLKKGDEVALYRLSDEKYIILERLVRI